MDKDEIIIQNIIHAAQKLMQQYGWSKTTMEDIAKEAGKGKSTLYYYFKSKEEIFDQVLHQEMDEFFHSVKMAVEKQTDAVEMLKMYIITKIKTLRSKINLYRFTIETELHTLKINDVFLSLRKRYDKEEKNLISAILNNGVENKLFKTTIQAEIEMLSELLVTWVRGVEMETITHNKYKTLPDKADLLVGILTKGIGR